jgi:hypothetical protein
MNEILVLLMYKSTTWTPQGVGFVTICSNSHYTVTYYVLQFKAHMFSTQVGALILGLKLGGAGRWGMTMAVGLIVVIGWNAIRWTIG